jgi:hypothetical protein
MLRALEVDPGFKATYDEQGRNTLSRFLLVIGSRGRERLSDSACGSQLGQVEASREEKRKTP